MSINVGIIGAGQIAKDHCRNIAGHPEARLAAVADISRERREQLRDEFGMDRAYASWQDLLADRELDAVAIALPNSLHAPVTIAALEAGKHVLLDKPFTLNYREASKVVAVARRRRKLLMLGMNRRYVKEAQELRALVERGELGDIYHARVCWMRRCGSPRFGTWFVNKKLAGGGCMLDIGVHMLDLAMHLMGNWQPAAVSGRVYSLFGPRGLGEGNWGKSDRSDRVKFDVDDGAYAFIKFRNGATLDLGVAWVQHQ
ncbi:MAG: Gfo/Idh/MocA family oxidoreductase, partial [Lentisphaerae bacterium]|nr:Gfo/Idh/MocA family oxidoreductase [Lentisphaerota bacterium]